MKVVHIESGLGNQMLSYCEYLALKKVNPDEKIYIENIIYDIPEVNDYISQWNGYELKKVFNIDAPNIKSLFSTDEWEDILTEIKETKFWQKKWNYPKYITEILNNHGLHLINIRGDFEEDNVQIITKKTKLTLKYKIKHSSIYCKLRDLYHKIKKNKLEKNDIDMLFYHKNIDVYTGQRLTFKLKNNNIESIEKEIFESFVFPSLDSINCEIADEMQSVESVAIHVRRGDMMYSTGKNYKNGYFKRAVKLIKNNVKNPKFYFFCNSDCAEWCKKNLKTFGLNKKKDEVKYIDWNYGDQSFRDMQLMTYCKHNIITDSSFGWWGAYLNKNVNKITISPANDINTTNHC